MEDVYKICEEYLMLLQKLKMYVLASLNKHGMLNKAISFTVDLGSASHEIFAFIKYLREF